MKTFNSVRKRLSHRHFSVKFEKFIGKLFCRTSPSNHFSRDAVFFSVLQISEVSSLKSIHLVEQWYIRRRNSQACSFLCSYGNQVETSLSSCRHTCTHLSIEKLCGKFSFHVTVDRELFTYMKNKK